MKSTVLVRQRIRHILEIKKVNIFDADVSLTTIKTHVRSPLRIFQEKEGEEYICSFQASTGCFTRYKTKM